MKFSDNVTKYIDYLIDTYNNTCDILNREEQRKVDNKIDLSLLPIKFDTQLKVFVPDDIEIYETKFLGPGYTFLTPNIIFRYWENGVEIEIFNKNHLDNLLLLIEYYNQNIEEGRKKNNIDAQNTEFLNKSKVILLNFIYNLDRNALFMKKEYEGGFFIENEYEKEYESPNRGFDEIISFDSMYHELIEQGNPREIEKEEKITAIIQSEFGKEHKDTRTKKKRREEILDRVKNSTYAEESEGLIVDT